MAEQQASARSTAIGSRTAFRSRHDTAGDTIRSAREKLTSASSVKPQYALELFDTYASQQLNAAAIMPLLAMLIAFMATQWINWVEAALWLAAALVGNALILLTCRRFRKQPPELATADRWRARFIRAEAFNGLMWALIAAIPVPADNMLALFTLFASGIIVLAVRTILSSQLWMAMIAGTAPIAVMILAQSMMYGGHVGMALGGMIIGAEVLFILIGQRMYQSQVETISLRAEKDALIGELETAKSFSDEARRRAEQANLAKSRFLATMSHELRTPLNAILGFAEVMKAELLGAHSNPAYKEYAGDIHRSGEHLLNLINEILDLSRIEAGRYALHEEPVSLAGTAADCRYLTKLRAKEKGVRVRETYETDLPRLWADERAVRQIVLNLLSNAIKFTPSGGEIDIVVGWTASGGQYLSISDSGPGIPEDEIPVILSSFGRGSLAHKNADEGTGLGLPIVMGLIQLHGGSFDIKSRLREGTEVTVTFPRQRVMQTLPPMPDPELMWKKSA